MSHVRYNEIHWKTVNTAHIHDCARAIPTLVCTYSNYYYSEISGTTLAGLEFGQLEFVN